MHPEVPSVKIGFILQFNPSFGCELVVLRSIFSMLGVGTEV
jgi:hypothetical protein